MIAALALLAGCQPKSSVMAEPAKRTGSGGVTVAPSTQTGANPTETGGAAQSPTPDAETKAPGSPPVAPPTDTNTTPTDTAPVQPSSGGPVTLRFSLDKGQELKYKSTSLSESQFATGTKMPEMKPVTTTSDTTVKVLDKSGDKAKVEMTVTNMSLTGGMANAEAQKAMQKMAKESAGVKVSAFFDSMGKPSDLKYEKGDRMQAVAAGIDSDTGFFGISYPSKAVNAGDTWTHEFDFKNAIGAFGPMKDANWSNSMIVTTFTLKSVDAAAGTAVIGISANGSPSMSMKMGTPPKGAEKAKLPSEMKMNFKVSGTGTATVELKNGLPKEISYEMSTVFDSPMGGTMTQKVKATLKRQ